MDKVHRLQPGDYATSRESYGYICYNSWVEKYAQRYAAEFKTAAYNPLRSELVRVLVVAPHDNDATCTLALCRAVNRDVLTLVDVDDLSYNKTCTDMMKAYQQNETIAKAAKYIETYTNCNTVCAIACAKRVLDIFKEYKQC